MKNDRIFDMAVFGGGLAGTSCALTAVRKGKRVLLIDRRPTLCWESTWACQLDFAGIESDTAGLLFAALSGRGGLKNSTADAAIMEMTVFRAMQDANVSLLLYSSPVRLITENGAVLAVVLAGKNGYRVIRSGVYVDATEDALLWRQTGLKYRETEPAAKQSFYFNHVESGLDLPLGLSGGIRLMPSVWKEEVRVEFSVDRTDPALSLTKIPSIIDVVRREVPWTKNALVTHAGIEAYPDDTAVVFEHRGIEHPELVNLIGAGIWTGGGENTPAGRFALGEKTGIRGSEMKTTGLPETVEPGLPEPDVTETDILVVGGGTGGPIAAMAAARSGVGTILIEASAGLGGMGTGGGIHSYYFGIRGGIQDELDDRIGNMTPEFTGKWEVKGFHPLVKKIILQRMLDEAGVETVFNTVVADVRCRAANRRAANRLNRIESVTAVGRKGVTSYRAEVYIDSTGDGDLAVMAGAPYIVGREKDNLPHAFSQSSGSLDGEGRLIHNNFDAGYVDPSDAEDLTRARTLGITQYIRDRFTEEDRLLFLAPMLGLRQSRQIIGEYQLTLADEIAGRRFPDAVSFTWAHYDNHSQDYENESDEAALWVWALGNWRKPIGCEVPFRCLIPKKVENLILACRALSVTFDAHMSLRMQNDIQRIGQAAGTAAALTVRSGERSSGGRRSGGRRSGKSLRNIDIAELQSKLKRDGLLDEAHRPKPAIGEEPAETQELVWTAAHHGASKSGKLRKLLNSRDPGTRLQASAGLIRLGSKDGLEILVRNVEERISLPVGEQRSVPLWQASMVFLGMTRDPRSTEVLIRVLEDENAGLDMLIGAVRSLGRIGDPAALAGIRNMLKRRNLPSERIMNQRWHTVEDARWQLELTAAETMADLGAPAPETTGIVEPHSRDDRAYVRRYAEKILRSARKP